MTQIAAAARGRIQDCAMVKWSHNGHNSMHRAVSHALQLLLTAAEQNHDGVSRAGPQERVAAALYARAMCADITVIE
jgi:hypothetical protein